jgi:hypothetical protein
MPHRLFAVAALLLVAIAVPPGAHAQPAPGRLIVTVVDQTAAVLQGAVVTVAGDETATRAAAVASGETSEIGVATFAGLAPGRYTIQVEFPGFEPGIVRNLRVRAGADTRQRVVLQLKRHDESVSVGRDGRTSGLDPRGDAFSTVLTREQIDALPDDPEEMRAVLEAMAPPGSTIRVDGFTGGQLPHKSQIRSIRLPRMDQFAAQNHGGMGGGMFIDIQTMPGMGGFRASTDFRLRDDALNARNPFVPAKGDERLHNYGFSTSGTIRPGRSSFSIAGNLARQYDTENMLAALPDGTTVAEAVRQPTDNSALNVRFDQALTDAHAVRLNFQRTASDRRNLGVGGFNLPERGYATESSQHILRFSENGPIGRRFFTETRLQIRWQRQESTPAFDAPTVRVLDAFTAGGAQQRGGRRAVTFELASDLDYVRGNHAMRTGLLVDGGRYRSDQFSNYLGTFTFASLEDYLAGRPRTYTRRIGDPLVEYSDLRVAAYVQDDWRMTRSMLLSYGLRAGTQSNMPEALAFSPRASVSWSPFRSGSVTLRASAGWFYDWLDMNTYEQSLRVDGFRQQELQILNPAWPDPGADGRVPPTNRYLLDPDRVSPSIGALTAGADRRLGQFGRVSLAYTWRRASNLLAGYNLNPVVDGVRPDPLFANVVEARAIGESRQHSINVGGSLILLNWRRTILSGSYTWSTNERNTTGAFSLPADADLSTEWGQMGPRHRASASLNTQLATSLAFSLNLAGQSGMPYNVTTGFDDNGDGVFNDRPADMPRNAATGAAHWTLGSRLTYSIGFGERPQGAGGAGGGGASVVQMGGPGGGMGGFGGGPSNARVRLDFFVSAQNLTNRANFVGYSGVMTSPFFGLPTNTTGPRKVEAGIRLAF